MADYKLIGKDYTTTDLRAKVTGRAKYSEDFRAEGMVFMKLLLSPMPHARVRGVDTSAALAMPGVEGILTADDLPLAEAPNEAGLTNEPVYEGEPILAVAAVDEQTASDAIELITLDLEPLPFVLDPLDSLRPDGPNARLEGNTMRGRELGTIKWTEAELAELDAGRLPMTGEFAAEWSHGDVEAGLAAADLPSVAGASAARDSQLHGLLGKRKGLRLRVDTEHGAHRGRGRPLGRCGAGERGSGRRVLRRRVR